MPLLALETIYDGMWKNKNNGNRGEQDGEGTQKQ